jgi:hypothetical protein
VSRKEERAIKSQIQKFTFQQGDLLVVKDERTMRAIQGCGLALPFLVPIVVAPEGINRVSRDELRLLLAQGEQHGYTHEANPSKDGK